MVLKLSKIVSFLHFFANVTNKFEAVIAVHVFAFECSLLISLGNGIGYYAMTYMLEDIIV